MPKKVTMGTAAALGSVLALGRVAKWKAQLARSSKGQMYLALAKLVREKEEKTAESQI